jgi:hypothetical protein
MTETKQLSLSGRLRIAAACPDINASLLAEAADAIEQHESFKREVSDAVESRWMNILAMKCEDVFSRFIISKPDPLVDAWLDAFPGNHIDDAREECAKISAALAARGLEIREKQP